VEDWDPFALVELGSLMACEQGSSGCLVAGPIASGDGARRPAHIHTLASAPKPRCPP
jgi:hypothetical protein